MEKPRWVDSHFVSQITEITALVHKLLSLALKWCNYKTNCDKTERGIGNRAVTQSSVARFCLLLRCWMPVKSAKVLLNKMLVQPPYCRHVWLTCWLTALSAGWTLGFHNWNMTALFLLLCVEVLCFHITDNEQRHWNVLSGVKLGILGGCSAGTVDCNLVEMINDIFLASLGMVYWRKKTDEKGINQISTRHSKTLLSIISVLIGPWKYMTSWISYLIQWEITIKSPPLAENGVFLSAPFIIMFLGPFKGCFGLNHDCYIC